MILLYLDILGTKAEWSRGGRPAVENACKRFRDRILTAAAAEGAALVRGGGIESDAAALLFDDVGAAVQVARRIYLDAFLVRPTATRAREWLRGALLTVPDGELRTERAFGGQFRHLSYGAYSSGLLDAISVEKAGYRGMRLLIEDALVSHGLRQLWRLEVNGRFFIPFRKLSYSGYPARIADTYQDFLWMGTVPDAEWGTMERTMAARLRLAAPDAEELAHAAATQIVFHECAAIRGSIAVRAARRR